VTTSPSINPDYPTTEPRLRDALRRLVDARATGHRGAPALISEADLFLRLCPAPTIGVTGTKGKTTTSSLIAAVLATDASHPVALGGNIGIPLVERLPELTPEHRVVIELSELQLPTLSRGTTVAVYTNVT
jgi:UDP-N-acetylmuramoylalanine--D-glutamate ligase